MPADDTMQPRVIAAVKTETAKRDAVIAGNRLTWEKQPSPRFAVFYPKRMTLAGISPTTPDAPQTLAARFGKQLASAPVEVTVSPLSLKAEPAGPLTLPVGQMLTLCAVANYKSGKSSEIPSHLLKWDIQSPEKAAGAIEVHDGKVIARKTGGEPVSVYATYYGNKSNLVEITPVAAEPLTLELQSKDTHLHPGDSGVATLAGKNARGPVELAPDQASFRSSDENVLKIDAKSGSYHAICAGRGDRDRQLGRRHADGDAWLYGGR